jgi:hypothetical protein
MSAFLLIAAVIVVVGLLSIDVVFISLRSRRRRPGQPAKTRTDLRGE